MLVYFIYIEIIALKL